MKKKLGFKLFIIMFSIITLIGAIQLFIQSNYFNDYYEMVKKQEVIEKAQKYMDLLHEEEDVTTFVQNELKEGRLIATSSLFESDKKGMWLQDIQNSITIDTEEGKKYLVIVGTDYDHHKFPKGSQLEVEGFFVNGKENVILATRMKGNAGIVYIGASNLYIEEYEEEKEDIYVESPMEKITGTVTEIHNKYDRNAMYLRSVADFYFVEQMMETIPIEDFDRIAQQDIDASFHVEEDEKVFMYNNIKNFIVIRKYDEQNWVLGVTTITPTKEVVGVLHRFSIWIFIGVVALSIIVSYLFSKGIKRPILAMISYAKALAKQDFAYIFVNNRKDELGDLGKSLEQISVNLQEKISTLENTNEQLQEEIKRQEIMKNNEKELVANIAHELKTPLTVMKGYVRGIESGIYHRDDVEVMKRLDGEIDMMNKMVISLLSLFRLQTQQSRLMITTFNLWDPILSIYDKLHIAFAEKGLELAYSYNEEVMVKGDYELITQVINNLMVNALKYGLSDTTIKIDLIKEHGRAICSIQNESQRMLAQDIERIWEPFYVVEKSRSKEVGGTGLGLAIVKEVLDKHNSKCKITYENGNFKVQFDLELA